MQVGGIYEQRDAQSVTYILEDSSLFYSTGYKVLKSQEGKGFVRCNHLTHNGKDKLVYDISKYKELSSLATVFDGVAFLNVFVNFLDSIINAKNNGFMQYDNIDVSFENVYVDCNNYKVYLIYMPLDTGVYNNDINFFEERFRYAASNFFENYFQSADENVIYICNVLTSNQYRFEDMKQILLERISALNVQRVSYNNIDNNQAVNQMINNVNNSRNSNMGGRNSMLNKQGNMVVDNRNDFRQKNNPMRDMGGSVSETMDISDLLKQIRKNGYYDEIGENTCFEDLEGCVGPDSMNSQHRPQNRLNLGGTPGSMSKANAAGINNLANSGVIPNVRNHRQPRNTNDLHSRYNYDREYSRDYDRDYDRDYNGRGPDRSRDGRSSSRNMNNSMQGRERVQNNRKTNKGINRTINATIRLISDKESGEIELIVDKEEFTIGKNFNVVDGFIPHNEGISRVHCKIIYDRGGYHIVDMGSLNGTYVNGARIPVKSMVPISVGDKIGIANIEFVVATI